MHENKWKICWEIGDKTKESTLQGINSDDCYRGKAFVGLNRRYYQEQKQSPLAVLKNVVRARIALLLFTWLTCSSPNNSLEHLEKSLNKIIWMMFYEEPGTKYLAKFQLFFRHLFARLKMLATDARTATAASAKKHCER